MDNIAPKKRGRPRKPGKMLYGTGKQKTFWKQKRHRSMVANDKRNDLVTKVAQLGSIRKASEALGFNVNTMMKDMDRNPEFRAAVDKAMEHYIQYEVKGHALHAAVHGTEETTVFKGKPVDRVTKFDNNLTMAVLRGFDPKHNAPKEIANVDVKVAILPAVADSSDTWEAQSEEVLSHQATADKELFEKVK